MTKPSKNLKKFVKISIKLRVFSDRLFVSSLGRWGKEGVHRGFDGEGVGNSGVCGQQRCGGWGQ